MVFASITGVDFEQAVTVELVDPDAVSIGRAAFMLRPAPGETTNFTFAAILPVAATSGEVAAKYPRFSVFRVSGKPVRERTGEWTWKVSLGGGSPSTLRFRLKP